MPEYHCWDHSSADALLIDAETPSAAAQEYVDGGSWGEVTETSWVRVHVISPDGTCETISVAIDPEIPDCDGDPVDHDWRSPYSVVGGIKDNPGVWGHGGGVIIREVCADCGMYRITDTWAQDPETGEEGLESLQYEEADEVSEAWVASIQATR